MVDSGAQIMSVHRLGHNIKPLRVVRLWTCNIPTSPYYCSSISQSAFLDTASSQEFPFVELIRLFFKKCTMSHDYDARCGSYRCPQMGTRRPWMWGPFLCSFSRKECVTVWACSQALSSLGRAQERGGVRMSDCSCSFWYKACPLLPLQPPSLWELQALQSPLARDA